MHVFELDVRRGIDLRSRSDFRSLGRSRVYVPNKRPKKSEESRLRL